jgi:outer membrane protein TolC
MKLKPLICVLAVCFSLPLHATDLLDTLRIAYQQDPVFAAASAVYQAAKKPSAQDTHNGATDSRLEQQRQLAQQQFKLAQQALVLRVAQAYFEVLSAEDRVRFAEQMLQANQNFEIGSLSHTLEAQAHDALIHAQQALANAQYTLQQTTLTPPKDLRAPGANFVLFQAPGGVEALIRSAEYSSAQIAAASLAQDLTGTSRTADELAAMRRAVAQQIRQSYLGVDTGIGQIQTLRNALKSAEFVLQTNTTKPAGGPLAHLDALHALQQVFTLQREVLQAQYAYLLNHLRLKIAMGSLGLEDLSLVNGMLH